MIPPAVAYVAWYGTVGHQPVGQVAPLATPSDAAEFAVRGLGHSTEVMLGLDLLPAGLALGLVTIAALIAATATGLARGRRLGLAVGCLTAVLATYATIGIARAEWDTDRSGLGRSTYVAAFFLVLAAADLFKGRRFVRADGTGWASVGAAAMVVVYASSVAANLNGIRAGHGQFEYTSDVTREYVVLARTLGAEPWVDQRAGFNFMPLVPDIPRMADQFDYRIDVGQVRAVPGERAYEDAVLLLIGGGFRVEPSTGFGESLPLSLVEAHNLFVTSGQGCTHAFGRRRRSGNLFGAAWKSRQRDL